MCVWVYCVSVYAFVCVYGDMTASVCAVLLLTRGAFDWLACPRLLIEFILVCRSDFIRAFLALFTEQVGLHSLVVIGNTSP